MVNHPNRGQRRTDLVLTNREIIALINAVAQMTDGNARDFDEWRKQTSSTRREWNALLQGEAKLHAALARTQA